MPYLRVTCPQLPSSTRRAIAKRLTDEINDLFFNPHSPVTREELRERTTVHFTMYGEDEMFIGARTPAERQGVDVTVELSDWSMSEKQQKRVARRLTDVIAELFDVAPGQIDGINLRFHPYPPKDFAVGGRLLSDMVPLVARIFKRTLN